MFSYSSAFKQYKNIKKYTTLFVFALALFFLQPASAWAAPSVSVDPPESVIYKGESKTLTWTIAGAVSCSGSYTGITSGTQTVSPFPEQVYTTTCVDGTGASASASAMVSVIPAVSLTASKTIITITQPETITLTWSSDGDSCVDNSLSSVAGTGSVDVSPSQTTTYRYTCWYNGSARNSSSSVEIKLVRSDTYCYGDGSNVTWLTNCDSPWRDTIEGGIPFGKSKVFQNYKQGYTGQVTVNCTNSGTTYNTGATCSGGGYYCSGPEPYLLSSNTAVYPGDIDTATLTSDLPWIYSATDTSRKCEWHCQAGFEYRKVSRDTWGCAPISNGGDPLPPSAVLDFSVDRNVVKLGQPIELTWSASGFPDGGGCERGSTPDSPLVGWNGRMEKAELEKDGSITFVPSDATGRNVVGDYTYSLCARSVTVRVDDPPVINVFKAEPSAIDPGQSSALSWEASGSSIAVCHLFNGSVRVNPNGGPIGTPLYITVDGKSAMTPDILIWTGGGGTGSKVVSPATTQDYTFICRNTVFKTAPGFGASYGFVSKTTRVTVNGTPDPGDGGGGGGGINPTVDTSCPSGATCKSFSTCDSSGGTAGNSCGGAGVCCTPKVPIPPVTASTPWSNPLAFNTVEGLLNSIWGFLQGIIVILSLIMIVTGALVYMTAAGEEGKLTVGKNIITAALIGLALALATPSFLKQIGDILGWSGTDSSSVQNAKSFLDILQTVINFLLSVVGVIAIIMLVIGGLMYLLAAGDEDRIKTGKKIVQYSLIGIAVALAALVLVTQVVAFFG